MTRNVNGVRKFTLLHWVGALEDGYREHQGWKQPATLSNLAALIVEEEAMEDYLERSFDKTELRKLPDTVYNRIKRELNQSLRSYYGDFLVSKEKIQKMSENHIRVRNGEERTHANVTAYGLTSRGRSRADELKDKFEMKIKRAELANGPMTYDTVKIPVETRVGWELEEFEIPRVVDGQCIDTGTRI